MAYTELKLNYLLETKEKIREAIEAKGQAVADKDTFRSYAEKIAAIGGSSETVVFAEQTLGFEYSEGFGAYYAGFDSSPFSLVDGQEYIVVWDGIENKRKAFAFTNPRDGSSCVALGNPLVTGGTANEDNFAIVEDKTNDNAYFFPLETGAEHTVKIYQKASGGGSVEGVHFVTFMSEDGSTELYKRPVADGDDCADPVIRGLIAEPTKESTAQYNYTHVGWSATPNGALDGNILKAVTTDKTVYANYAAVLRYYTVNFYDGDTLLESQTVAYGSTPSIEMPTKDGYSFTSWSPSIVAVIGNADYYAQWIEAITFAGASWSEIAEIAEAGEAANYFKVGDTREVNYSNKTVTVMIVGFNHDELSDGTGTAGITMLTLDGVASGEKTAVVNQQYNAHTSFESELASVIKTVKKEYDYSNLNSNAEKITKDQKTWLPSVYELNSYAVNNFSGVTDTKYLLKLGSPYEYFLNRTPTSLAPFTSPFWTRNFWHSGDKSAVYVSGAGNGKYSGSFETGSTNRYTHSIMLGFCI